MSGLGAAQTQTPKFANRPFNYLALGSTTILSFEKKIFNGRNLRQVNYEYTVSNSSKKFRTH